MQWKWFFFNLSRYFLRCCTQNLCKAALFGKVKQCQIYMALFQPFCEYTAWKVLIKYHLLHSWIQLLNSLKQASKNNKHIPIIFTSPSLQPKRLTIKMTDFSQSDDWRSCHYKNYVKYYKFCCKISRGDNNSCFGEKWHPNFPFRTRSPKRTFQTLHSEGNILHKLYCTGLVFPIFPIFHFSVVLFTVLSLLLTILYRKRPMFLWKLLLFRYSTPNLTIAFHFWQY